jgi:DUF1009 family protein
MGHSFGIIAGSGDIPRFYIHELKKRGDSCVVAAVKGEAPAGLSGEADVYAEFALQELNDLVSFLKSHQVENVYLAGKIEHRRFFQKKSLDPRYLFLVRRLKEKGPQSLVRLFIDFLADRGISTTDPFPLLEPLFCSEGSKGRVEPSPEVMADMVFGWDKARFLADQDIGQTLIVKDGTVVAVEGMEGTDLAIQRAGKLAGDGCVAVKVIRTHQDYRIDLPAVGAETVRNLIEARFAGLCFEADRMPFFQREEAVQMADRHGLALYARSRPD